MIAEPASVSDQLTRNATALLRRRSGARDRRAAPRRVHGSHSERRRAARARSAGDASRTSPASSACSSRRWSRSAESHACGVWLLETKPTARRCDLWMAHIERAILHDGQPRAGSRLTLPRESMSAHLLAYEPGWTEIVDYDGRRSRACRSRCARSTVANGIDSVLVAPLVLPTRTLGWIALVRGRAPRLRAPWRRALLDAIARQATLALHHSRLAEQSRPRSAAPGRARRAQPHRARHPRHAGAGLRRHPDAAAGGAALGGAAAAGGRAQPRHRRRSRAHAPGRGAPLGLRAASAAAARSRMSRAALTRMVELARRTHGHADRADRRRAAAFDGGVEREIIGIAQEALTNAVRHARARRITIRAAACAPSASGCRWPTMAAASPSERRERASG